MLAGLPIGQEYALASGIGERHSTAPPAENPTVVTSQNGHLLLYGTNGTVQYDGHRYQNYWDVDPVPSGDQTVLFAAGVGAEGCPADDCVRNVVEQVNPTTNERTRLFSRTVSTKGSSEWHDVDRINETHLLVADINRDRVFTVNTATDTITWQWNASEQFSAQSGGPPDDWTHLNDVEYTENGRVMVSIRNQDQVIFVEPGRGVIEDWTLGVEGNFSVLHGQHNPDYISKSQGGPAVLVADSHNDRAVEYQRRNGKWIRTWQWSDDRLQWPRDADRLSNGDTLITDTNGDRVLEVNDRGAVVWSVTIEKPYEAERLATGDESATGRTAAALGLRSRTSGGGAAPDSLYGSISNAVWAELTAIAPPFLLNSLLFVVPKWMGPTELVPLVFVGVAVFLWLGCEMYWRSPLSTIAVQIGKE